MTSGLTIADEDDEDEDTSSDDKLQEGHFIVVLLGSVGSFFV